MTVVLWIFVVALTAAFAYTLQFSAETLAMGRALSGTGSRTGFQDAITPPWETRLALGVYAGLLVLEGVMWWQLGWESALAALVIVLAGAVVLKTIFARAAGGHYQQLILGSMISRYADYVRDRDVLRAEAMKKLLVRSGIDPDSVT